MKKLKINLGVFDTSYLPLLISGALTVFVIHNIYFDIQSLLKEKLRERLVSITSTAALQISAEDIGKIHSAADLHSPELKRVINTLNSVRSANKNLRYIYIWRKTADPKNLEFVVDAEMLQPIDADGNGKIEGDEIPPQPGEPYPVDQIPESTDLFDHPVAQKDFIVDKWGKFLSGYAPVRDKSGKAVAVLGIDVEVSDFNTLIAAAFIPFLTLTALLLILLSIQNVALIRIWKNRVGVVRELDRQKDELLGIVTHQLGKPITAIRWNLESMMDGDEGALNEGQKTAAESMYKMAIDLADLVSMILDVSRIQLGRINFDAQPLNLIEFFKEMIEVVEPTVKQKKINFVKNFSTELPTVLLDKRYTRMTIENLLTNAVKYTPQGGSVTLDMQIKDNILHCKVSDTGCGIPKEDQSKIFGKMYRASNVRNAVEGNGFGLYVAKGAVEGQGGKIWFDSSEGKGTTFFIELPVTIVPKA